MRTRRGGRDGLRHIVLTLPAASAQTACEVCQGVTGLSLLLLLAATPCWDSSLSTHV